MEAKHISEILPMALSQSKELQTQEQKPLEIGEERKLSVALTSRLIKDSTFEEVKEALRLVMMKVGLRAQNLPNDLEKLVLYEHIVSNFGGNRIEEIRLAFEMGMAGKLTFAENESIIPFENFSCLYFSTVMSAYQRWSSQAYRQLKTEFTPEQKIFTQEELDNSAREDAERQYQLFLKGYPLKSLEINKVILEKDGLLQDGELVIDFFKRQAEKLKANIYVRGD